MDRDSWLRLNELWEQMLRLSDEGLRAVRQEDADVLWRCMEQQRATLQEATRIKEREELRRR